MTRTKKIALGMALSACAVSAFGASTASAQETNAASVVFDRGSLKLAGSADPIKIVDDDATPNPVNITASVCINPAGPGGCPTVQGANPTVAAGQFRITPANFGFPPFTSTVSSSPLVTATVDLIPQADITGQITQATGALVANTSVYTSDITLAGAVNGQCTITPINLGLSTEKQTPFLGDRFNTPVISPTNGVVVDSWPTLPAATGPNATACAVLNAFTDGPGGIALANGITPVLNVPAPPPPVVVQPTVPAPAPATNNKQKTKKPCKKKKSKKGASSAAKGKNCGKKKKK